MQNKEGLTTEVLKDGKDTGRVSVTRTQPPEQEGHVYCLGREDGAAALQFTLGKCNSVTLVTQNHPWGQLGDRNDGSL